MNRPRNWKLPPFYFYGWFVILALILHGIILIDELIYLLQYEKEPPIRKNIPQIKTKAGL